MNQVILIDTCIMADAKIMHHYSEECLKLIEHDQKLLNILVEVEQKKSYMAEITKLYVCSVFDTASFK